MFGDKAIISIMGMLIEHNGGQTQMICNQAHLSENNDKSMDLSLLIEV